MKISRARPQTELRLAWNFEAQSQMQTDLSNRDYCRSRTVHTSSTCQKKTHALIFNNHCGVNMVDPDALPPKSACWHSNHVGSNRVMQLYTAVGKGNNQSVTDSSLLMSYTRTVIKLTWVWVTPLWTIISLNCAPLVQTTIMQAIAP